MLKRELGEILTVSIATAKPLEVLLEGKVALPYEYLFINIRTAYRNFHGSFEQADEVPITEFQDEFLNELLQIKTIVSEAIHSPIQPVFYLCTNKSINASFKYAKLKQAATNIQLNYDALERKVIQWLSESQFKTQIKLYDCLVKGSNCSALMITHLPLDLLSDPEFKKLDLLESHTGAIKGSSEWITKITSNPAYRNLPFNIMTLQILGDKATQFNSMGVKYITPVVEVAERKRWSAATTKAKIKFDIEKLSDKLLANVLVEMLTTKLK